MKLVILEPLGVTKEKLLTMAELACGDKMEIVYYDTRIQETAALIARSKDADAVILSNFPYTRDVMAHCPNLKMVCVAFTGVDHIDLAYCREKGITVCNCAGYSTAAVADLVFGFVVGLYRRISACDNAARSSSTKDGLVGFELEGKTFGVVGTGAIGRRVASIAQAFGCRVLAWSRTERELPGVQYTELDTLLQASDIVSLHVPVTEQTKHLIDAPKLALMKPSALLINTARGPVVDSDALAAALQNGKIAGAGIDVLESEPPFDSDHPLLHTPNTIVTPHVAFATAESMEKRAVIVFENIRKWLHGMPQNIV